MRGHEESSKADSGTHENPRTDRILMPSIIIMGENAHRQRFEYEFFFHVILCESEDEGERESGRLRVVPNMMVHAFSPKSDEVKEGYENYWVVNINGLSFTPFLQEKIKDRVTKRIRKFFLSLSDKTDDTNTFVLDLTKIWSEENVEYGDTIGIL